MESETCPGCGTGGGMPIAGCQDLWHIAVREPLGQVVISRSVPLVLEAPGRTLMSVDLLRAIEEAYLPEPDLIYVGNDARGDRVLYRIVGWDAAHRGLLLRKEGG